MTVFGHTDNDLAELADVVARLLRRRRRICQAQ